MLLGAFVPEIDYQHVTSLVYVVEGVLEWIQEYPNKIKVCSGDAMSGERQVLELDAKFLCQFVTIRRAFHLKKTDEMKENFRSMVDITGTLHQLDCQLRDVLNVYKIFLGKLPRLTKIELARCDRIVEKMGFDKQWSQYFYNSRSAAHGLSDYIQEYN